MREYRRYQRPAPAGSIVVRIVDAGGEPFGFVREVADADEDDSFPSEQRPIEQVWRLVENKRAADTSTEVFVEMEAGVEWRVAWGVLQ